MSKNIFITGTGTDVGKTFVSGLIVKKLYENGYNAGYFKAAVSGNEFGEDGKLVAGDAEFVKRVSRISQSIDEMCPYVYKTAVSPHLASKLEGDPVELMRVQRHFDNASKKYDYLTVEGSGGIVCPLRYDDKHIFLEDVIKAFDLSCIIVADAGLGTINNVVLTNEYMKFKDIPVKGIIFNHFHNGDVMQEDNLKMCEELTGIKIIACVEENASDINIDPSFLAWLYE